MAERILADLSYFQPELALTVTFLLAVIADLIVRRTPIVVASIVMIGFVVSGILVLNQAGVEVSIFSNMIAVDPFAVYFKLLIVLAAILIVMFSLNLSELNTAGRRLGEYYTLLVALTLGMMLMAGRAIC